MYDQENVSYDYICYTMNTYRPKYHIFFSTISVGTFTKYMSHFKTHAKKKKTTTNDVRSARPWWFPEDGHRTILDP